MEVAARRLLESALADQYRSFLANPDPAGPSATTYRYRLAGAQAADTTAGSGTSHPWAAIIAALAGLAAAAAGVVFWAHS